MCQINKTDQIFSEIESSALLILFCKPIFSYHSSWFDVWRKLKSKSLY